MERSEYQYKKWINFCLKNADRANIFKHAHETTSLRVENKIPNPHQRILDPTQGWLYDYNRRDHILCCPKSGRPVFDEYGRFTWALDLKPKPKRTVSAPERTQNKQEKDKKPKKKQTGGSGFTCIPRPVGGLIAYQITIPNPQS
ncbi:8957e3a2-879f-47e8-b8fc-b6404ee69645-CDS [Sclerotinia trifoliorum]|uniref:8957e3a2-879f-47e8-b8fc-b6404ee69645-CDS n=1 Tax=Sclerotinia trifoliorum TaxID=28548 RepID=A0A8H2VXH8_9HELO|nr:8957e3a2-879f-47e8-b8fc-b6404ee69645-CDS [Sclerotinia trifoliorum]